MSSEAQKQGMLIPNLHSDKLVLQVFTAKAFKVSNLDELVPVKWKETSMGNYLAAQVRAPEVRSTFSQQSILPVCCAACFPEGFQQACTWDQVQLLG